MTYDLNITFDDNLVTGNDTIDTQHKELIDRIRNFAVFCEVFRKFLSAAVYFLFLQEPL